MERPRNRALSRAAGLAAALLAAAALACGGEREAGPAWPEGALVVGREESIARLLAQLASLEGTPLARRAREAAQALPGCPLVEGRSLDGDLWGALSQLACLRPDGPLAVLEAERRGRDLAVALPLATGGRARATVALAPSGDVEIELRLPDGAFADARRLIVPDGGPVGPIVLSDAGSLVHARLRPAGGLDIASLVAAGGQADRLFRLKSGLFAGAVLDGTWEAAVYRPPEGRAMPRAALAVGFRHREPAVAAMEHFVRDLQSTWPVRRSPFAVGEAAGACLLDMRILPDFAPCYVATRSALVVGWNPESVRQALAGERAGAFADSGGWIVDFARIAATDVQLLRLTRPDDEPAGEPPARVALPWRRLVAEGEQEAQGVRLRVRLEAGADA